MRMHRLFGDEFPRTGKISTTACLGGRTPRAECHCCGGSLGVRRGHRKTYRHGIDTDTLSRYERHVLSSRGNKPKHKDHRRNHIWKDDPTNTGG